MDVHFFLPILPIKSVPKVKHKKGTCMNVNIDACFFANVNIHTLAQTVCIDEVTSYDPRRSAFSVKFLISLVQD